MSLDTTEKASATKAETKATPKDTTTASETEREFIDDIRNIRAITKMLNQKKTPSKPSLKSLIQEMGFSNKTPEYQALKFLEATSPKCTTKKKEEIINLTSPVDSPEKNETLFIVVKKTGKIADNITDDPAHEEHEKQEDDNNNNEEIKEKRIVRTTERNRRKDTSPQGTINSKLKNYSFLFPLKGECHLVRIGNLASVMHTFMFDLLL